MVNVYHYNRDPSRAHSIPFRQVCQVDETVRQMKERLQKRLDMNEKEWQKVKVTVVGYDGMEKELEGKSNRKSSLVVKYVER